MADFNNLVSDVISSVRDKAEEKQQAKSPSDLINDIINKVQETAQQSYQFFQQPYTQQSSFTPAEYTVNPDNAVGVENSFATMKTKDDDEESSFAERFRDAQEDFSNRQSGLSPNVETTGSSTLDNLQNNIMAPLKSQGLVSDQQTDEVDRRFLDENGELKENPLDWNIFGFSSQKKSPDDINQKYESLSNIEPTSKSADKESRQQFIGPSNFNESIGFDDSSQPMWTQMDRPGANVPLLNELLNIDQNLIDDGRSEDSREAMYMTGEQYLRYKNELGIPGRPDRLIDPDELYSKQDEMENYGFIPYLKSDEAMSKFQNQASTNKVSNLFNDVANARRNLTDFNINYDGKSYSGKDFEKNANVWYKRYAQQADISNPENESRKIWDKSQASEFAIPQVATYSTTDSATGQTVIHKGEPKKYEYDDGSVSWVWPDGTQWSWDNWDQVYADNTGVRYDQTTDDDQLASMWYEVDPLELDTGELIRADKAAQMMGDVYSDMDAYADYGPLGMGKQYVESPMEGVVPWLTDIFLGSSPLFYGPTAGTQAVAGTVNANQGLKPGYQDYLNRTYSMVSENPREDQRLFATTGNAILPLTERIWGPMGGSILKVLPATKKFAQSVESMPAWKQYLAGVLGEAAEEVPGNIVEQMMSGSGVDWYANPVLNDDGTEKVDSQGTVIYDPNTSWIDRLRNFGMDAPLSMLGGGVMGGILGLPHVPEYHMNYLQNLGNIQPGYSENVTTPLNQSERSYYNNRSDNDNNKPMWPTEDNIEEFMRRYGYNSVDEVNEDFGLQPEDKGDIDDIASEYKKIIQNAMKNSSL